MRELHELDDKTASYVVGTRRAFEDLRQVTSQIAGILVLTASGANTASPDHPMLVSAVELHRSAIEAIQAAQPTMRAYSHHRCLVNASVALAAALSAVRKNLEIDPVLIPLRRAYTHLQRGSRMLPGFEMVSFEQGCCAIHPLQPESLS
jgi:hypothetical protein